MQPRALQASLTAIALPTGGADLVSRCKPCSARRFCPSAFPMSSTFVTFASRADGDVRRSWRIRFSSSRPPCCFTRPGMICGTTEFRTSWSRFSLACSSFTPFFPGAGSRCHWNIALAFVMFLIMLVFYIRKTMGGGDLKLLTVGFLWAGYACALPFTIFLLVFALIHAIVVKMGYRQCDRRGRQACSVCAYHCRRPDRHLYVGLPRACAGARTGRQCAAIA